MVGGRGEEGDGVQKTEGAVADLMNVVEASRTAMKAATSQLEEFRTSRDRVVSRLGPRCRNFGQWDSYASSRHAGTGAPPERCLEHAESRALQKWNRRPRGVSKASQRVTFRVFLVVVGMNARKACVFGFVVSHVRGYPVSEEGIGDGCLSLSALLPVSQVPKLAGCFRLFRLCSSRSKPQCVERACDRYRRVCWC